MISSNKQDATISSQKPYFQECRQNKAHERSSPQSLPALDVVSIFDCHTLGHVVDLVHTDKTGSKFELQEIRQCSIVYKFERELTMLFLKEITMNCAFLVRSLM